jgi:hypothetical protein
MADLMPTGPPMRRYESTGYVGEHTSSFSKVSHGWLEYVSCAGNLDIQHQFRGGEYVVGRHGLPVDGYCASLHRVYQFHGCYWHGHDCGKNDGVDIHPTRKQPMGTLLRSTRRKEAYIRSLGYDLVVMWECEWERSVETDAWKKGFLRIFFQTTYPKRVATDLKSVIEDIRDGRFFGLVEADIEVPENLKEKFAEMAPIFKNVEIGREHLSDHMREFAEDNECLTRPQRMLVGSLFGKKILLASPLVRWYLQQGLRITRIYQLVEYKPAAVFKNFADSVSDARRAGDANPELALLASTSKLVGNSAYGKTITDKDKHVSVKYVTGSEKASLKVRGRGFVSLNEVTEEFFEVVTRKRRLKMDVPVIIGFFVLQYAKLLMLRFYFDFMDKFVDRSDFEYIEMDTDSAYMAISGRTLESIVKPSMVDEFYERYGEWFPRPYCDVHRGEFKWCKIAGGEWIPKACCARVFAYDSRTPGLFKEEFEGDGIIALNPKTYYCWSDETDATKYSSKGLSKTSNRLTKQCFMDVLTTTRTQSGVNRGFVCRDNKTYTYTQQKKGLGYFYGKRKVCADGVSTTNTEC